MSTLILVILTVFTVGGTSFEMIPVEGGTFQMGGTIEQRSEFGSTDRPVHQVALPSYYIGKTEVTRGLWKAVMGTDSGDWLIDELPVDWVSWVQCQEFISRLNDSIRLQQTDSTVKPVQFRLPTEAEWEYAARGGKLAKKQTRYSGSFEYEEVAWLYLNADNRSHPVATLAPNALGIYDMSGNVWEWTADYYADYTDDTQIDPRGPEKGTLRVVRGASWDNATTNARLSARDARDPEYSFYDCGLRLAYDGEPIALNLKHHEDSVMKIKAKGQQIRLLRVYGADLMMMDSEVTQALYNAVMGIKAKANPASMIGKNLPQNNISYNECLDFIYRLDSITGYHFRLPTSDEWELAATGGAKSIRYQSDMSSADKRDKSAKKKGSTKDIRRQKKAKEALGVLKNSVGSWGEGMKDQEELQDATLSLYDSQEKSAYAYSGSNEATEVGWISANSGAFIHPVKKLVPNELGLYDMTGNVAEWTTTTTEDGALLVRGGSYISNQAQAEVVRKQTHTSNQRLEDTGLRLVLDL